MSFLRQRITVCILLIGMALSACIPSDVSQPTLPRTASPVPTYTATSAGSLGYRTDPTRDPNAVPTNPPPPVIYEIDYTYLGPLEIAPLTGLARNCDQGSPFDLPGEGIRPLAYLATEVCFNSEIALMERDQRRYVIQAGGPFAAYTLSDVTDPLHPARIGAWKWLPDANTVDLKPFQQNDRWLLALALRANNYGNGTASPCGVALADITDLESPVLLELIHGTRIGALSPWCNVQSIEIVEDEAGDGAYLLIGSNDTFDLRVLDIRDPDNITEVNQIAYPHPVYDAFDRQSSFVSTSVVSGDRVYVSFRTGGVLILDRNGLVEGLPLNDILLNRESTLTPETFFAHQAVPSADHALLFVSDQTGFDPSAGLLKVIDIRDLDHPLELFTLHLDNPLSPPHDLQVVGERLFVGWYQDGIRIFDFDLSDGDGFTIEPTAYQAVRSIGGEGGFSLDYYDGIYDMRVSPCQIDGVEETCVYASDMRLGLLVMVLEK